MSGPVRVRAQTNTLMLTTFSVENDHQHKRTLIRLYIIAARRGLADYIDEIQKSEDAS